MKKIAPSERIVRIFSQPESILQLIQQWRIASEERGRGKFGEANLE